MNPYAPPQPGAYPAAAPAAPPEVPTTGLKVFAILEAVLGGLGLLFVPLSFVSRLFVGLDSTSRRIHEATWSGAMGAWLNASIGIGAIQSVAMIAGGIGVYRLLGWARTLSIGYAVTDVVTVIVGQIMSQAFLYPALRRLSAEDPGNFVLAASASAGTWLSIFGTALRLAIPVAVLVVLTRQGVKSQFGLARHR
jgi:hypothetical protein